MFQDWTDERFAAWFAGFFDGEGCIHLPPKGIGVEVTVANTVEGVITGICERLQCGIITAVEFNEDRWKTKYHWRVRNYADAESVILVMYPHLVIKQAKADEALNRIRNSTGRTIKGRNQKIIDLAKEGYDYNELAEQFRLSYRSIARICQGIITPGNSGYALPEIRKARETKANKHKNTRSDLTTTTSIGKSFRRKSLNRNSP